MFGLDVFKWLEYCYCLLMDLIGLVESLGVYIVEWVCLKCKWGFFLNRDVVICIFS